MDNIYVIRERIEAVYGKHSKSFDKAFQFILAMITFTMINQNTGFMKSLSSPVISLGLAVVATFLPPAVLVVLATILLLAHTLAASIGIFAVSALIFLIMYIFYIRLAPKMAFVVLLTPIAFALKIPFVVPVACALIYTPVSLVPMGCGTVVYYMMEYLKKISAASKTSGSKAMLAEISTYVQKVFQNKEMWLYIVAFIIGFFIIYTIRRQELDHAWKIGIIAGAIANVVVTAMGSIALGVNTSYGPLIIGNIVAAVAGLVLELFLFSVDYARSERLQFEDDENDAEKSINAYNATLDKGTQVILGCVTTTPCIAVSAQAYDERVFMLTPSASSLEVIANKDNAYQVCFTDPAQGSASAEYIFNKKVGEKVAIIYNNADTYSTGIYQTFESKAAELGLNIVSVTTFTNDTTDFSVQVTEAKNAGADVVFLPIYYTPASQILNAANTMGYKPVFFGVDGMDGILTMPGFDVALAEDVMLLTPFSADAPDELTKSFVGKYQEKYGEVPNQFAADAYDGIYALAAAAEKAGVKGDEAPEDICDAMIAAMQELTVTGLTGTMVWDATGAVTKTPTAVIIKNGVYVGAEAAAAE